MAPSLSAGTTPGRWTWLVAATATAVVDSCPLSPCELQAQLPVGVNGDTVLAYTSFEEPTVVGGDSVGMYTDTLGSDTDHPLINNAGENPVVYAACSNGNLELGFMTMYIPLSSTEGLTDGDKIGVIGDTTTPMNGDGGQGGQAPHGSQYFMLEDSDAFVYVHMDPVEISSFEDVVMSGWLHVEATTWESSDVIKVWAVDTTTAAEVVLLEATNADHTADITFDVWTEYVGSLGDLSNSATMSFGLQSNSGAEEAWFDLFKITGTSQVACGPPPGACSMQELTLPLGAEISLPSSHQCVDPLLNGSDCVATCGGGSYLPLFCRDEVVVTSNTCCEAGSVWSPEIFESSCVECPAGRYQEGVSCAQCGAGSSSNHGATECVACVIGSQPSGLGLCSECEPGLSDHDSQPTTPCMACGVGFFTNSSGSAGPCTRCPAGQYSDAGISSTSCNACEPGQSDHDSQPTTPCMVCGVGFFTNSSGSAGPCTRCPAGQYSDAGISSTSCNACPRGQYQPSRANSSSDDTVIFAAPIFTNTGGPCDTHADCAIGAYCHLPAAQGSCQSCVGTAIGEIGLRDDHCGLDQSQRTGNVVGGCCSDDIRAHCPSEHEFRCGTPTQCIVCPRGRFSNAVGASQCLGQCGEGESSNVGAVSAEQCNFCSIDSPCPHGSYCVFGVGGSSGTCEVCVSGECGCTDSLSSTFSASAIHDDGSCMYNTDACPEGWVCYLTPACGSGSCEAIQYENANAVEGTDHLTPNHLFRHVRLERHLRAVYLAAGSHVISDAVISSNHAASSAGGPTTGAGARFSGVQVNITRTTFADNYAAASGAAIYLDRGSTAYISLSSFVRNDCGNYGSAINFRQGTLLVLSLTLFEENTAGIGGGALYSPQGDGIGDYLLMDRVKFVRNFAEDVGDHISCIAMAAVKIVDSVLDPFEDASGTSVNIGGTLSGCEQHPCRPGFGCSYVAYSLSCTPCSSSTASIDGLVCAQCDPGFGPSSDSTSCDPCPPGLHSPFGNCEKCPPAKTPSRDKVRCDDVSQVIITDVLAAVQVVDESNLLPRISLQLELHAEAPADGHDSIAAQLHASLAESLEVSPGDIAGVELRVVTSGSTEAEGRRRLQSGEVLFIFDFVIKGERSQTLINLSEQLADPSSALLTSAIGSSIDSTAPIAYSFVCPSGTVRQTGESSCTHCAFDSVPNEVGSQCIVCPFKMIASADGSDCICEDGYFDHTLIWPTCYSDDYSSSIASKVSAGSTCVSCLEMDCISSCQGDWIQVRAGWSSLTMDQKDAKLSVLKCKQVLSCPGALVVHSNASTMPCATGYAPPLCGVCAANFAQKSDGSCEACTEGNSTSRILFVLLILTVMMFLIKTSKYWYTYLSIVGDLVSMAKELKLKTVAKTLVTSLQIIGSLENVLSLHMPDSFANFLAFNSWVRFDFISAFSLGCLSDGGYKASVFSYIVVIVAVGLLIYLVYKVDVSRTSQFSDSEDTKATLRELFDEFDSKSTGFIDVEEVLAMMQKVDPSATKVDAKALFAVADSDGGGTIDVDEFVAAATAPVAASSNDSNAGVNLGGLIQAKALLNVQAQAVDRLFVLVFLLYPAVTNKIFEAFSCRDVADERSLLQVDYSLVCESEEYTLIYPGCLLLVLLWPIGIPGVILYKMWRVKDKILAEDPDTLSMFEPMLGDYNLEHWCKSMRAVSCAAYPLVEGICGQSDLNQRQLCCIIFHTQHPTTTRMNEIDWEVVELARKLILTGLISLFRRGSIVQTVVATFIAFCFFAATVRHQPFERATLNLVKVYSEFQVFGILLMCVVLQTHARGFATEVFTIGDYGVAQLWLVLSILPFTAYCFVTTWRDLHRTIANQLDADSDEANSNDHNGDKTSSFENPIATSSSFEDELVTSAPNAFEHDR